MLKRTAVVALIVLTLVAADRPKKARANRLIIPGTGFGHTEDGDTLHARIDKQLYTVRLDGIDAPELTQTFGAAAKQKLSQETAAASWRLEWDAITDDGVIVGDLYAIQPEGDERNVALELLKQGAAWQARGNKWREYREAMEQARKENVGLWKNSDPTPPWDYRRTGREKKSPKK